MAREELEAVIREQLTRCVANAIQSGVPSTGIMNRATEEILKASDARTVAEGGVAADRRRVLGGTEPPMLAELAPITHFGRNVSACGSLTSSSPNLKRAKLSLDAAEVTCGACKRSHAWKAAS